MSASWRDDDEEFRVGGVRGGLKAKPRFSFTEVKLLLEAVKRNRYIILSEQEGFASVCVGFWKIIFCFVRQIFEMPFVQSTQKVVSFLFAVFFFFFSLLSSMLWKFWELASLPKISIKFRLALCDPDLVLDLSCWQLVSIFSSFYSCGPPLFLILHL